jgi:hypothetical protein
MKTFHKALVAGGVTLAVLVPAASALADGNGPGRGGGRPPATCTADQAMDRVQARDGTGWRHTTSGDATVQVPAGAGQQHRGGPNDGSGPRALRPMDGSGVQWRVGRW